MFNLTNNPDFDYYEQSKFNLTWYLHWLLGLVFVVLISIFSFIEPKYVIHYGLGLFTMIFSILRMKKTKRYRLSAKLTAMFGFVINVSSFFLIGDAPHLIEAFWLLNISMYAYFTLGSKWGNAFLFGEILVVTYYISFCLKDNLVQAQEIPDAKFVVMSFEMMVTMAIFAVLVNKIVQSHNYANRQFIQSNNDLILEKKVVENQNKEKTVLLQEIHHRVKNNLQVIVSLLRLQSHKIRSVSAKEKFQESINRIMTMSLIHQKMYEGDSLSKIDLNDYFNSLINDLIHSNSSGTNISKVIEIEISKVGNKSLIPLALLINELVTNSIKHGFDGVKDGIIDLRISSLGELEFEMIYSDNGTWKESLQEGSMGLDLVESFTEQLDGRYEFEVKDGRSVYTFNLSIIDQG